jgi:phage portal protein BeeE
MSYALEVSDLIESAEILAEDIANIFRYNERLLDAMGEVLEQLREEVDEEDDDDE